MNLWDTHRNSHITLPSSVEEDMPLLTWIRLTSSSDLFCDWFVFFLLFFLQLHSTSPLQIFKKATNPMLVTADSISVPRYLFDGWNYIDQITYFFIVAAGITRAVTASHAVLLEPDIERQLMAASTPSFDSSLMKALF